MSVRYVYVVIKPPYKWPDKLYDAAGYVYVNETSEPVYAETEAQAFMQMRKEHIVLAEKALGRPLPKGSQVHHVNSNKGDNGRGNLVICQDAKYHSLLHRRTRKLHPEIIYHETEDGAVLTQEEEFNNWPC